MFAKGFGFFPNGINWNVLEQRREIDSFQKNNSGDINLGYVRLWKICGGEIISQEDNESKTSSVWSDREKGFELSDIQKVVLIGLGGCLSVGERKRQEDDSQVSHMF